MTRFWIVPACALAVLLPWLPFLPPFWITLANTIGIASVLVIGLVVLTGTAGITSFGQASFLGFGAYTTSILSTQYGLSPWLGLPAAILVCTAISLPIGAITLRLSGHYLALGTIAWSVAIYYVFANLEFFGRNDGIRAIPPLHLFGYELIDVRASCSVIWTVVIVVLMLTANLLDSRIGRAIRALRGGAVAAASFGVDTPRTRTLAFAYAAVLAGIAGWLYAHLQRAVNPTPFGPNAGIEYLLMAVVGGAAHIGGAVVGATMVTLANDQLQDWLPRLLGTQGNYETIVFGVLLVAVLQLAPEGIWPHLAQIRRIGPRRFSHAVPLEARRMPPAGTIVLEARNLRRTFGGLIAVNDLTLSVAAGEIVGLIGPNGAGKSTTFNLLTGVDRPTAGTVSFSGADITAHPSSAIAALGIARSFQHVRLVPGMSVIENVTIGAHLRGQAGALGAITRLDRIEEAALFAEASHQLARVGLAGYDNRAADSLALGQQRIVEIARALCLDPLVLLLDEPAAGLRHGEKSSLADLLRQLRADGMAILLVEHDIDFVMGLVDRLIVMDFGTCLAQGDPDTIRSNPDVIEAYLGSVA